MNYKQSLEYIEELSAVGIVPGLDRIRELCGRLGNPQNSYRIIHVAGTNGKGAVANFITSILKEAGIKAGTYSSPAVFDNCEKFRVAGRQISKAKFATLMTEVRTACEGMVADGLGQPSPFETETALAYLFFAREQCEIAVVECGMGGLEDATNLVTQTAVAVFTPIGMDHSAFLGNTPEQIAKVKSGIIKPGCKVVSAVQDPKVETVLRFAAKEAGCNFSVAEIPDKPVYGLKTQKFNSNRYSIKNIKIGLAGNHQIANASLAIEAVKALEGEERITDKVILTGLQNAVWPGRFEVLGKGPAVIIDGAHNPPAARVLAETIRFHFTNKKIIYIIGMLKDKDYEQVIAETYAYAEQIITVTPPENPRALDALYLAETAKQYHPHVTAAESPEDALEIAELLAAKDDVILCFGSLSYLKRIKDAYEKRKHPGKRVR